VVQDVLHFPERQRGIHDAVHGQMALAPEEPRRGVVGAAQHSKSKRHPMYAEFQLFAVTAAQKFDVRVHGTTSQPD